MSRYSALPLRGKPCPDFPQALGAFFLWALRREGPLKRDRGNDKSGPNTEGFGPLGSGFILDRKSTDSTEHGGVRVPVPLFHQHFHL